MKTSCSFILKSILLVIVPLLLSQKSFSQYSAKTDSVIRAIMGDNMTANDEGVTLIKNENYSQASLFYSNEIKKDEGNKEAYFNRGALNWVLNNKDGACRDWSAVLALGDTESFKLLDQKCHGAMLIEDDTIPKAQYHKMWATEKKDNKTMSANSNAVNVADEMPQYTGGDLALMKYLSGNIKYPAKAHEKNIQGTVYVNFIVSRKGKVLFPYVVRGIGNGCDEEALRVIRNMPQWKPGTLHGKPVLVRYNLPVKFNLK